MSLIFFFFHACVYVRDVMLSLARVSWFAGASALFRH